MLSYRSILKQYCNCSSNNDDYLIVISDQEINPKEEQVSDCKLSNVNVQIKWDLCSYKNNPSEKFYIEINDLIDSFVKKNDSEYMSIKLDNIIFMGRNIYECFYKTIFRKHSFYLEKVAKNIKNTDIIVNRQEVSNLVPPQFRKDISNEFFINNYCLIKANEIILPTEDSLYKNLLLIKTHTSFSDDGIHKTYTVKQLHKLKNSKIINYLKKDKSIIKPDADFLYLKFLKSIINNKFTISDYFLKSIIFYKIISLYVNYKDNRTYINIQFFDKIIKSISIDDIDVRELFDPRKHIQNMKWIHLKLFFEKYEKKYGLTDYINVIDLIDNIISDIFHNKYCHCIKKSYW